MLLTTIHRNSSASSGSRFSLAQPWRTQLQDGFCSGEVFVCWTPGALHVQANLIDDEIVTSATADNQKLWKSGDVFEIFIMVEGHKDYVELHVTPMNKRLHLHLPGVGGKAQPNEEPLSFEEMLVSPVGFTSSVTQIQSGWLLSVAIPASVLGMARLGSGTHLRMAFARYDAASDREPILSTTAAHPVIAFHRPDEWTRVLLAD